KWLSNISEIPDKPTEDIEIFPSDSSEVINFTTREYKENVIYDRLNGHMLDEMLQAFDLNVSQKRYCTGQLLRPPISPKQDSKYLLVTSGFTDGTVGSVESDDLHMMRGVAKIIEQNNIRTTEEDSEGNGTNTVSVTTSTSVELRILEANGNLTLL
ncbi:MAG: hypothetical protein K6F84_02620, partial [Lachnospiraceae bacterium]|nr:hypothetical protein [Lachnospiraceae bacterium]